MNGARDRGKELVVKSQRDKVTLRQFAVIDDAVKSLQANDVRTGDILQAYNIRSITLEINRAIALGLILILRALILLIIAQLQLIGLILLTYLKLIYLVRT